MAVLPMTDPLVVLELTGEQLLAALENGVSQYPKWEGRFPQVSGLSFSFNPNLPSSKRILSNTVCVNGKPVQAHEVCARDDYACAGMCVCVCVKYACMLQCSLQPDPKS